MMHLEIEVHDDEWADFEWLPSDAYECVGSTIGINWNRIRITDPVWMTFARLKYPEIAWSHAV